MTIKLKGSTDGSVSLSAPADTSPTGTDITLTLPTDAGSANQFLKNSGTAGTLDYSSMVEDSSGNVGIGTASPSTKLEVDNGNPTGTLPTLGGFLVTNAGTASSTAAMCVATGSGPIFNVMNNGNVGIGTTSPSEELEIKSATPALKFSDTDEANSYGTVSMASSIMYIQANGAATSGQLIYRSGNAGVFSEHMRINGLGRVMFGTQSTSCRMEVNGDIGIGRSAGAYTFRETVGGDERAGIHSNSSNGLVFKIGNQTEAARFDGSGNLAFASNNNNPAANGVVGIALRTAGNFITNMGSTNAPNLHRRDTDGDVFRFFRSNGSTDVGAIRVNSSQTFFDTTSDHRLKENAIAITDGITRVKQLQPKRFNFIIDPEVTVDGFFAHETQTVVPEAVDGTYNEVDDDNNPVYQSMDQSKLVPLLTAALQEAITKIETLEAKVAALEAA